MTLVDTLDTLVIIGDYDEFENSVKLVINNVKLDSDIIVSVFETNIRMVGYVCLFFFFENQFRNRRFQSYQYYLFRRMNKN